LREYFGQTEEIDDPFVDVDNRPDQNATQDRILTALQRLKQQQQQQQVQKQEVGKSVSGTLTNPWGLDFWDPQADNYYRSVTASNIAEQGSWINSDLGRYNLNYLNAEYGTSTTAKAAAFTTTAPTTREASPSPWDQLGKPKVH
jgi:hypothetical protein